MIRKLLLILSALLLLCGFGVLLYPSVQTAAFRQAEKSVMRRFDEYRTGASAETESSSDVPEGQQNQHDDEGKDMRSENRQAFRELWEACVSYNLNLVEAQPFSLTAQSMNEPAFNLEEYGWDQEVFACLSIPSADIETPLYLGANRSNLNKGGVILGQTSLPIGGKSTHCVIGGHRTWNGILHPFVSLERVRVGDYVYVTNPWETLSYRVIATETIWPDDLSKIRIQEGKDLLSVFTCTYPNTHRILVLCERMETESVSESD